MTMPNTGVTAVPAALAGTLRQLAQKLQLLERGQVSAFGFTSSQSRIMLEVAAGFSVPMHQLAAGLQLDSSTLTRTVDNLVRDGLLQRARDRRDRRLVLVQLTPKGQEAAAVLEEAVAGSYQALLSQLPPGAAERVLESARLLLAALGRMEQPKGV
jgi:DNA-binding MarR family transcriptional regulator